MAKQRLEDLDAALVRMEEHIERFERDYLRAGKLPRNHVWRPYRFCVQDVVVGLTVVKHSLERNALDVDVCIIEDAPDYEEHSGAKMMAAFLLSESYKCGGTMELNFDGEIPPALCRYAHQLHVDLPDAEAGRISPIAARHLYLALSEFSDALVNRIVALAADGKLSPERVCYVVHRGVWTQAEVEAIVQGSQHSESILGGGTFAEQRHLYMNDLLHARAAIMGGHLDRVLAMRERSDGDVSYELEDDVRRVEVAFDPVAYAKVYSCDEDLTLLWSTVEAEELAAIPASEVVVALLRARNSIQLEKHLRQDLASAASVRDGMAAGSQPVHAFVVVPRDYESMPADLRQSVENEARMNRVGLLVCPDTVAALDTDAASRLSRSRIMRQ